MKKSFLLTFICLFIVTSFVFAQNLRIYNNDTLLANNTVLNITGSNSQTIVQYLLVKNISNTAINVKVKKIYNSIVSGSENTFCFGVCYDPMTFLSDAILIAPNAVDSGFSADYNAHGGGGTSSITYVFFNTANTSDSASVILNFTTTIPSIDSFFAFEGYFTFSFIKLLINARFLSKYSFFSSICGFVFNGFSSINVFCFGSERF